MSEKLSKQEAEKHINEFFSKISDKKPNEIRKIKKLAMGYNIKLKDKRKLFCKKCFSVKIKTIGVKNKIKRVQCENCKSIFRFRIK